jgi:hypothetical protein
MAAIALIALQAASVAAAEQKASSHSRPIVDTHIHFYQPTRPGGVPWPPAGSALYRDVLPSDADGDRQRHRDVGAEVSPPVEDNQRILDAGTRRILPVLRRMSLRSVGEFHRRPDHFSRDHRFVGIRGFLWSPPAITSTPRSGTCANSRGAA